MLFYRSKIALLQNILFFFTIFTTFAASATTGVVFSSDASDKKIDSKSFNEQQFHQVLLAEFYNQSGEPELSLQHYLPVALHSDDPDLVKRVTEIAAGSGQLKQGLKVAQHWVKIAPNALNARQYLTLLLLRDGQLEESANQLSSIRLIVESGADKNSEDDKQAVISKGLKFIGALLVIESHHDKAYQVFNHYLKQLKTDETYGDKYKEQEDLILASLAMEAKKYQVVVSALRNINKKDFQYFSSAAVMKTKALKKLGKTDEAAKLLQRLVDIKKTSDSKRLELTRLLISLGKNKKASEILNSLVEKHPDNNDLLKALIALNINQLEFKVALVNNKKLAGNKAYQNTANYFYGEIFEGQGKHTKALKYYQKVNKGTFLKNSYSKTAKLLVQIKSLKNARDWLQIKQKNSLKLNDKAYWMKLEADLLTDKKLSATGISSQDNINTALNIYNKLIKLRPKKVSYHYHRGLLYERANQIKFAEKEFKFVIDKRKNNAEALNALGFLLLKHTTRLEEAKNYILQAYSLKPNDPVIMDSLGWAYFQTGDVILAEKHLRNAFKTLKSPEVASHLIEVLSKSKKYQEARQIFNKMIKKHPNNASLDGVRGDLEHI